MKIRTRVTLSFTVVVSLILLVVCVSIYFFSDLNRELNFKTRLHNRALTTVSLLLKVEGIDSNLLKRIDETTLISIQEKSVVIYDNKGKEVYVYTDHNVPAFRVAKNVLDKAKQAEDYYFTDHQKDIVVLEYANDKEIYKAVAAATDRQGFAMMAQLKWILLFSFIGGVLISLFSGFFFSKRIVSPIKSIMNEVREISSKNLSRRIIVTKSSDELDKLSATFNELLDRLQESFLIQQRFIANASHELSTPLTSISSQLEITLTKGRSSEEYRSILFSVYEDVKNLNQLTRSLLEIAKASGTAQGIELSSVRVDELLMKLPAHCKNVDAAYKVELNFESFPDEEKRLMVFGNSDLLYSAIQNIVLNACKFSNNHQANVSLLFSENHVRVNIQNTGSVISKEERDLIFYPFYRGIAALKEKGVGLGLSLAQRIIKIHKGEITVQSADTGSTTFSIQLPIENLFHQL